MGNKQLHKKWRVKFNKAVFDRDNFSCRKCGYTEKLDAHHITDRHIMPQGGYVLNNGISLCEKCHIKAEEYHRTNGKSFQVGFHPNDLYKLINSSYEKALEESKQIL